MLPPLFFSVRLPTVLAMFWRRSVRRHWTNCGSHREPTSYIVFRLDGLGDVVLTTPLFRALKSVQPDARLTVVVQPDVKALLATNPHIDEILTLPNIKPKWLATGLRRAMAATVLYWKQLRGRHFEFAISPRWDVDEHLATFLCCLVNASYRVGYSCTTTLAKCRINRGFDRVYDVCLPPGPVCHEVQRNMAIAERLGATLRDDSLDLRIAERDRRQAAELLANVPAQTTLIALGIGAQSAGRRWPIEGFAETVHRIGSTRKVQAVIVCSAAELSDALRLRALLRRAPVIVSGVMLREVCAVLERCDVFLGNDSGCAHLAAAVGCAAVVISRHPRDGDPNHFNSPVRFAWTTGRCVTACPGTQWLQGRMRSSGTPLPSRRKPGRRYRGRAKGARSPDRESCCPDKTTDDLASFSSAAGTFRSCHAAGRGKAAGRNGQAFAVIRPWSERGPDLRHRRIFKAVSSGAAAKLLTAAVSVLTLPLAVRYLGPERYGVWATITTTAVWINLLDLGIANTLTNEVSRAYALNDKEAARRYFTNAMVMTVGIAAFFALIFAGFARQVSWVKVFNVGPSIPATEVERTVGTAVGLMVLALPCNLVSKLLAGYQELHRNSVASAIGALASLVGLALGIALHVGMPMLYVMSLGCITFTRPVMMLVVLWQKRWLLPKPSALDPRAMKELLDSGSFFFLIQVAAVVVFSSDNLIVSHYLGASEVTPYNVTWRLAGLSALLQSLMFPALWPAYAEAYARHEFRWIRNTFAMTMNGIVALNVLCAVGLVLFGRTLIRIWVGPAAVPGLFLLLAMAVWIVVNGFMSVESCLLAAMNRTRAQALLSVVAAGLNIALSVALVQHIGAIGVIGGTILSYLIVLVVPQTLIVRSVWRRELRASNEIDYPTRNGLLSRSAPMVVKGP